MAYCLYPYDGLYGEQINEHLSIQIRKIDNFVEVNRKIRLFEQLIL